MCASALPCACLCLSSPAPKCHKSNKSRGEFLNMSFKNFVPEREALIILCTTISKYYANRPVRPNVQFNWKARQIPGNNRPDTVLLLLRTTEKHGIQAVNAGHQSCRPVLIMPNYILRNYSPFMYELDFKIYLHLFTYLLMYPYSNTAAQCTNHWLLASNNNTATIAFNLSPYPNVYDDLFSIDTSTAPVLQTPGRSPDDRVPPPLSLIHI